MILTYEGSKIYEIVANHSMTVDQAIKMAGIKCNEDTLSPECFDLIDESEYTQPSDHIETIEFLKSENVHTYVIENLTKLYTIKRYHDSEFEFKGKFNEVKAYLTFSDENRSDMQGTYESLLEEFDSNDNDMAELLKTINTIDDNGMEYYIAE